MTSLRHRIEKLERASQKQIHGFVARDDEPGPGGRHVIRGPHESATSDDWLDRCRRGAFGVLFGLHVKGAQ